MKQTISPPCPACGCNVTSVGPLARSNFFAGRFLESSLDGGFLYKCNSCELGFRWPRLPKPELDALYKFGADRMWSSPVDSRLDWRIGFEWVVRVLTKGDTVLDIGCFDGGFLDQFKGLYDCSGIEIHAEACQRAEKKGVTIIGHDFSETAGQFAMVTAFDVIEHVDNPLLFINQCLDSVSPNGYVLISSGNFNSPTFLFLKNYYWYCSLPEHISFVSPQWFLKQQAAQHFRVRHFALFSHFDSSLLLKAKEFIVNTIFWLNPNIVRMIRNIRSRIRSKSGQEILPEQSPGWGSSCDHFIILLQKT